MLILTRKVGQVLEIDGPCKIHVIAAKCSGEIRIGIEAERKVNVVRGEAKCREPKEIRS